MKCQSSTRQTNHILKNRISFAAFQGSTRIQSDILLLSLTKLMQQILKKLSVYTCTNPSLAEHGMPYLGKQCRSRSVGF